MKKSQKKQPTDKQGKERKDMQHKGDKPGPLPREPGRKPTAEPIQAEQPRAPVACRDLNTRKIKILGVTRQSWGLVDKKLH